MAKKGNTKEGKAPHSIQNRRARYDYAIQENFEAGIALVGSEVKSIYLGKAHLTDAYCRVVNNEMWLINMDIEPYEQASVFAHERRRDRKLLLHRREIDVLQRKSQEKGLTMVPLAAYFKNGRVKIDIGLGRGKAHYDKRDKIAKDDERREIERAKAGKEF
ncbi:SsrA-binding protein SmpB [Fimbriimonas ginsengisoli]|uniref:SsrA-binding protein n=1 Tax=Fimbriimonas ginsengisoli Gsoil 348 TaxID=661478 RepID=A0A068NYT7_FIMGI|nr:SsrA-binding protein SmpB [Fimbriimonas ginsengisoli]AIE87394.1 SsrA-binding protein [Fimbriimonas ginsengisoli Gsoil 348]